ncbi:hypothetical protein BV898_06502 [Hypsibius exemplaris]|uniref:Uncharacterized protein n=1 Tax=Hypsibius exemplaris TaxID=2072580 RepID=A0A1W0WWE4_HYPEX|nr:hypothetical protein BV898_06502 [Hypsibius exemplaris]
MYSSNGQKSAESSRIGQSSAQNRDGTSCRQGNYSATVSEATIRRLADGRLEKKKLKKVKVHYLTAAAILQRSLRALPFYDLIKDDQFMRVFSMDEAMLPLDYENGQSEYYYAPKTSKSVGKMCLFSPSRRVIPNN